MLDKLELGGPVRNPCPYEPAVLLGALDNLEPERLRIEVDRAVAGRDTKERHGRAAVANQAH